MRKKTSRKPLRSMRLTCTGRSKHKRRWRDQPTNNTPIFESYMEVIRPNPVSMKMDRDLMRNFTEWKSTSQPHDGRSPLGCYHVNRDYLAVLDKNPSKVASGYLPCPGISQMRPSESIFTNRSVWPKHRWRYTFGPGLIRSIYNECCRPS